LSSNTASLPLTNHKLVAERVGLRAVGGRLDYPSAAFYISEHSSINTPVVSGRSSLLCCGFFFFLSSKCLFSFFFSLFSSMTC
jgi:hypothetical protein